MYVSFNDKIICTYTSIQKFSSSQNSGCIYSVKNTVKQHIITIKLI